MLLVFPSQKGFVWVFKECAPVGCRRVHSHRFSHEFPDDPPTLPIDSAIEPEIYARLASATK